MLQSISHLLGKAARPVSDRSFFQFSHKVSVKLGSLETWSLVEILSG